MASFETLDSDHKADMGCPRVGRLLWLKAFDRVSVRSTYRDETDELTTRQFRFSVQREVEQETAVERDGDTGTTFVLDGYRADYQKYAPKTVDIQEILDDTKRATNTSGSTQRKHLGSGLYRCGSIDTDTGEICGKKVTGAPRGYTCPGHMVRTGPAIDDFVTKVISERLARPDAVARIVAPEQTPQSRSIDGVISEQRIKIARAQRDYDAEIIEGHDLKRVRDATESKILELEKQKIMRGRPSRPEPVTLVVTLASGVTPIP